jgi:hypothetical protein
MEDWIILAKSIMPDCTIMNESGLNTLSWKGECIVFQDPIDRQEEKFIMEMINNFRDSILGCTRRNLII